MGLFLPQRTTNTTYYILSATYLKWAPPLLSYQPLVILEFQKDLRVSQILVQQAKIPFHILGGSPMWIPFSRGFYTSEHKLREKQEEGRN